MRLSKKKKQDLYDSLAENIMDLRVDLFLDDSLKDKDNIDLRLFNLENTIWADVKRALNITD